MSNIIWALCWPPVFAFGGRVLHRSLPGLWKLPWPPAVADGFISGGGAVTLTFVIMRLWIPAAIGAGQFAIGMLLWWWWRRRRKRRRALALLGAKSRALIAAMVRRVREEQRPSRVLRPQRVPS